jgi:hypothetical protein
MSRPQTKDFICPVCGQVIKAPFRKEQITEHIKTHPENTPQARRLRPLCKKGGQKTPNQYRLGLAGLPIMQKHRWF